MIGRFCGQEFPYENKNIVSSHNSLYFWFHSDNSVSYDGFAFEWNSVKPICGGSLTNDYGTISSPGSPGRYPPNRDCYWQITVKSGKRIQIHFGQLMLEEHPTCGADFLEASVRPSFNPSKRRTEDIYIYMRVYLNFADQHYTRRTIGTLLQSLASSSSHRTRLQRRDLFPLWRCWPRLRLPNSLLRHSRWRRRHSFLSQFSKIIDFSFVQVGQVATKCTLLRLVS